MSLGSLSGAFVGWAGPPQGIGFRRFSGQFAGDRDMTSDLTACLCCG